MRDTLSEPPAGFQPIPLAIDGSRTQATLEGLHGGVAVAVRAPIGVPHEPACPALRQRSSGQQTAAPCSNTSHSSSLKRFTLNSVE